MFPSSPVSPLLWIMGWANLPQIFLLPAREHTLLQYLFNRRLGGGSNSFLHVGQVFILVIVHLKGADIFNHVYYFTPIPSSLHV